MSYTALYRKYRPARFEDVLGQDSVVKTLKNQLNSGKVSHAYLFCGTRGTGKTSLAKIFAKAINCLAPREGEPCGACSMCAEIAADRSLNVIEIDAASNNGVDNIRDIREEAQYTPTGGTFKVYIIDEVHMLSAGAYNALLKTLEEPPAHVIFILATTDPQKIPPTIHSRCQRYDFRRIPSALISERLSEYMVIEGIPAEKEALRYIARVSDGSMRDALSLLDRCVSFFESETITLDKALDITGSMDSKGFFELTAYLNEMNGAGALAAVDEIVEKGRDISQIILEALSHFRNLVIAKSVENPSQILEVSDENAHELKRQAEKMDAVRLMSYIRAFSELQANSRYSPNQRALLEIELIKLCSPEIINNSYEELYNKVLGLERKLEEGIIPGSKTSAEGSGGGNTASSDKPKKQKQPKINVMLPGEFGEIKERFEEIKGKLAEERENSFFSAVIERAEVGFLDDKSVYLIFEDETNEDILRKDTKRQETLKRAIEAVTGKTADIKTITRAVYDNKIKGINIVSARQDKKLLESVKSAFDEFDVKEDKE